MPISRTGLPICYSQSLCKGEQLKNEIFRLILIGCKNFDHSHDYETERQAWCLTFGLNASLSLNPQEYFHERILNDPFQSGGLSCGNGCRPGRLCHGLPGLHRQ